MTDLDKLIEAVEAGSWDHDAAAKWQWRKDGKFYGWAHSAFLGSLDSAKALHEALLPDWRWSTGQNAHYGHYLSYVMLSDDGCIVGEYDATGDNPARAWLLAILRAYRSQQ